MTSISRASYRLFATILDAQAEKTTPVRFLGSVIGWTTVLVTGVVLVSGGPLIVIPVAVVVSVAAYFTYLYVSVSKVAARQAAAGREKAAAHEELALAHRDVVRALHERSSMTTDPERLVEIRSAIEHSELAAAVSEIEARETTSEVEGFLRGKKEDPSFRLAR